MPVSDRQRLWRRLLSSGCALSLSLSTSLPALAAAEIAAATGGRPDPSRATHADWLAEGRGHRGGGGSGGRSGGRSGGGGGGGGGGSLARPSGGSRPSSRPGSAGSGAIGRPAPGFDRGNRRPSGGWVNNVPESRPRPGGSSRPSPLPGVSTRPAPRPDGNRPGGSGSNRPDWNRPDGNRPGIGSNRPGGSGGNRPDWNRPDGNRPGIGSNRPGGSGGNRPDWNRPGSGNSRPDWNTNRPNWNNNNRPNWNRPGWDRPDWVFNRRVNINTSINVRPNWWGPTWYSSRPWRSGWFYGPTNWGWWGGSSLAWGITSLASAAIIATAINNAVSSNTSTIDIRDSPYQLVFGTVTPVGATGVSFSFLFQGEAFEATADCREGLINGRRPSNPEEAQLINAACQVAFASF